MVRSAAVAALHRYPLLPEGDTLPDEVMDELKAHRDAALGAWENAIAATAVHYINDTLQDVGNFGTDDVGGPSPRGRRTAP